jgi:hypothetical protein
VLGINAVSDEGEPRCDVGTSHDDTGVVQGLRGHLPRAAPRERADPASLCRSIRKRYGGVGQHGLEPAVHRPQGRQVGLQSQRCRRTPLTGVARHASAVKIYFDQIDLTAPSTRKVTEPPALADRRRPRRGGRPQCCNQPRSPRRWQSLAAPLRRQPGSQMYAAPEPRPAEIVQPEIGSPTPHAWRVCSLTCRVARVRTTRPRAAAMTAFAASTRIWVPESGGGVYVLW